MIVYCVLCGTTTSDEKLSTPYSIGNWDVKGWTCSNCGADNVIYESDYWKAKKESEE